MKTQASGPEDESDVVEYLGNEAADAAEYVGGGAIDTAEDVVSTLWNMFDRD